MSQNQQLVNTVNNACRRIPELAITTNLPVEVRIHSFTSGVRDVREETTRMQLELNIQIVELRLKAQPCTPLEIKEQRANAITAGLEEIGGAVRDCTNMLVHALEVLTTLQEDPNIQQLETEARELQQHYTASEGLRRQ